MAPRTAPSTSGFVRRSERHKGWRALALAAAGEDGVRHMLDLIEAEMRVAMALTGLTIVDKIGPETLAA